MKVRIIVGLVVILLVGGGGWLWFSEATTPVSSGSFSKKIFVIKKGENIRSIADRLEKEGLIRSPIAFYLLVRKNNLGTKIQAGDFRLSPSMSTQEIAEELTHGTIDIWVTVPEGWRNGQIAMELSRRAGVNESEFLERAKEGYMFPDTYLIPKKASASAVVNIFEQNFDKKVRRGLSEEFSQNELNINEVIILASIVEREAKLPEDRPMVAGVLLNRLEAEMPLQADATLQYIKGFDEETGKWWPPALASDKEINSAYNTYQNPGLPPEPIANPGLAAIKAVLNPVETDYLYYLSESDGTTHYAKTLDEHNKNIQKYLK